MLTETRGTPSGWENGNDPYHRRGRWWEYAIAVLLFPLVLLGVIVVFFGPVLSTVIYDWRLKRKQCHDAARSGVR